MAFQEKSAWIMAAALILTGIFYFSSVASMSSALGNLAPPNIPVLAVYTVLLAVLAISGHIAIALFAPKEANTVTDERERRIFERAGHWSGYIFGAGVILSLGLYLVFYDGNLLFYGVFGSLMLSQLAEYLIQIVLYRNPL